MHQVSNYDLIVSQAPEATGEVLLLAVEFADVPQALGSPQTAKWVAVDDGRALDVVFQAQDGSRAAVRFANVAADLAERLAPFDRVLMVWLGKDGVVGEEEIPLTA